MKKKDKPLVVVQSLKRVKDYLKDQLIENPHLKINSESRWTIEICKEDTESEFYLHIFDNILNGSTPMLEISLTVLWIMMGLKES